MKTIQTEEKPKQYRKRTYEIRQDSSFNTEITFAILYYIGARIAMGDVENVVICIN